MQDSWDVAMKAINDAILRKAMEKGIKKEQAVFNIPHIQDMGYIYINGTICLKCK